MFQIDFEMIAGLDSIFKDVSLGKKTHRRGSRVCFLSQGSYFMEKRTATGAEVSHQETSE